MRMEFYKMQTEKIRIMLACAGGMSTSLLMNKMKEAAQKRALTIDVWATGVNSAKRTWQDADVLLIGPQVRYEARSLEEEIQGKIPFAVIDMRDYGTMNGEKVLDTALALLDAN